ncbi:hypothetical protein BANRA_03815 [Klebsiella pneumoniae]|nr:hypothetical protein BANRA_03815 [Klebsiella pneumoniae]
MTKENTIENRSTELFMILLVDRFPQAGICLWKSMAMEMPMTIWMIRIL